MLLALTLTPITLVLLAIIAIDRHLAH